MAIYSITLCSYLFTKVSAFSCQTITTTIPPSTYELKRPIYNSCISEHMASVVLIWYHLTGFDAVTKLASETSHIYFEPWRSSIALYSDVMKKWSASRHTQKMKRVSLVQVRTINYHHNYCSINSIILMCPSICWVYQLQTKPCVWIDIKMVDL